MYNAWTTPELVKRWWSANRGAMTIAEIDLRVGGIWRYVMVTNDGFEVAFHGEYREIVPNERLVSTEVYETMPDGEAIDTLTLTEQDGRTTLTILVQHTSKEDRDAHINSGMEDGMQDAMDLLEDVAVSLRKTGVRTAEATGTSLPVVAAVSAVPGATHPRPTYHRRQEQTQAMDWTLEVVMLPVSDIDRSSRSTVTRSAFTSITTL